MKEDAAMFTNTSIALFVALVLGTASVVPTMAKKTTVRHHVSGSAQQYAPAANAGRTPAVLPFTAEEQAMFDRASRVLGAGR